MNYHRKSAFALSSFKSRHICLIIENTATPNNSSNHQHNQTCFEGSNHRSNDLGEEGDDQKNSVKSGRVVDYHEPGGVQAKETQDFIEESEDQRMEVAANSFLPLPGEMTIPNHHHRTNLGELRAVERRLKSLSRKRSRVSDPNTTRWATSSDCQCSSGLK